MTHGTHNALPDARNENVLIYINGDLVPRADAKISVFDSGYLVGDGVWEGIRLHHGIFVFLDEHLDRLYQGAKAIALNIGMTRSELTEALYATVRANNMHDNVHARLMITRGIKKTPSQDPRLTITPPTIVIIAEHKIADPATGQQGIRLHTSTVRRGSPDYLDPRLNCHSKLHEVIALVQALEAGADEALMLDIHGFVSTCNATNFFIVKRGEVWTSTGQYCMNGITRGIIIALCHEHNIVCHEKNFSLTDVYDADEAFVTGTFGGLTPVIAIDGRQIGDGTLGTMTQRLAELYRAAIEAAVLHASANAQASDEDISTPAAASLDMHATNPAVESPTSTEAIEKHVVAVQDESEPTDVELTDTKSLDMESTVIDPLETVLQDAEPEEQDVSLDASSTAEPSSSEALLLRGARSGRSSLFGRRQAPSTPPVGEPIEPPQEAQPLPDVSVWSPEQLTPPATDLSDAMPDVQQPQSTPAEDASSSEDVSSSVDEMTDTPRPGLFRTTRQPKESSTTIFTGVTSQQKPPPERPRVAEDEASSEKGIPPATPGKPTEEEYGLTPDTTSLEIPMVTQVTIFHTNDMHGQLTAMTKLSAFARHERHKAAQEGSTVFFWDAGDAADRRIQIVSVTKGTAFVPVLNAMGYTLMTMGNAISLPYGPQAMTGIAARADFPILAANCRDGDGPLIEGLKENVLLPLPNGLQMGVFGLTAPWDGFYEIYGLHFPDFIETARRMVADLRKQGADVILALSHLGLEDDERLAQEVEGIDAIIGAHSHDRLPRGKEVAGVLIAQAGQYAEALGRVDLVINGQTRGVVERRATVLPVPKGQAPDPDVVAVLEAAKGEVKAIMARSIGVLLGQLELDHFGECSLGNIAADALRTRMKADAAMLASGLFNQGLPVGTINFGQLDAASFASANPCVTLVRGEQILAALERGLDENINQQKPSGFRGNPVGIPQISGLTVEYTPNGALGSRIKNVIINRKPLDPASYYRLAHTDAETAPGYGYLVLDDAQKSETEVPTIVREMLEEYLHEMSPVMPPACERWQAI